MFCVTVPTNRALLFLQLCQGSVQDLLDIRLNEQTVGLHADIANSVVDGRLEVVLTVLRSVERSLDENRARAENDLPVAHVQLTRETVDLLQADHKPKELVQRGTRSAAVENAAMTTHLLAVGHDGIPTDNGACALVYTTERSELVNVRN